MSEGGEKKYKASAQKIARAKEKGQVARTRELGPALAFLGVATAASAAGATPWLKPFHGMPRAFVDVTGGQLGPAEFTRLCATALYTWLPIFGVLLGAAAAGSSFGMILQGGPAPTAEPIKIDVAKLNPTAKLKSLFSMRHGWDSLRSFLAGAVAAWIVWAAIRDLAPQLNSLMFLQTTAVAARLGEILIDVAWRAGLALVLLGGVDLFVNKFLHMHQLKMTREEMKQEYKDQEGRPEVKAQRRRRQMEMSRARTIADVRHADVVVTNPTHYAVALSYRRSLMAAPKVVAKGRNRMALRIREEARKHGVPVVENPPLARELYRTVEVEHEIPPELYLEVAEVIAYVMKIGSKLTEVAPATTPRTH